MHWQEEAPNNWQSELMLNTTPKSQSSKMQTMMVRCCWPRFRSEGNMALSQLPALSRILWHWIWYYEGVLWRWLWYNKRQTKTGSEGTILSNFSTHVESDTEVWHEDKEKTARRLTDQNSACQHISGRRSSKRRGICDARQRMKEKDLKEGRKDC